MSSTCTVRVQIIDINDNDPQFLSPEYKFYVPENSCNGTLVGYINVCLFLHSNQVFHGHQSQNVVSYDNRLYNIGATFKND